MEFTRSLEELAGRETNYAEYLRFGLALIQNLILHYEKASPVIKQKLIGSIFPENLIVENGACRTARENETIAILRGFQHDFETKKPDGQSGFCLVPPTGRKSNQVYCGFDVTISVGATLAR